MLKNMIRKGLTNTQNNFFSRPKTATSNHTQTNEPKRSMKHLNSGLVFNQRKKLSVKKSENEAENHLDYNINVEHPQ
jgi:hypothetical protein